MGNSKRDVKSYSWLLYWVLVLALIVFAILQVFMPQLIAYLFGGLFVIIGLSRIAPFIIIKDKLIKWLNFGDLLLNLGVGAVAIIYAKDFGESVLLPISIGAVFFINGAIHFFSVSLAEGGEKDKAILIFFLNMIELTFGTYLLFTKDMNEEVLKYVVLGCLCVVALIFFVIGYNSFMKYYLTIKNMTKEEFKQARKTNKKDKKKKDSDDELENKQLQIDPTLENDFDEEEGIVETVEEEPQEEEPIEETIVETVEEQPEEEPQEEEPQETPIEEEPQEVVVEKDYMEDKFVKLDDLLKEKNNKN